MDVLLWEVMNYDIQTELRISLFSRPSSVKCVDFHSYDDVILWSVESLLCWWHSPTSSCRCPVLWSVVKKCSLPPTALVSEHFPHHTCVRLLFLSHALSLPLITSSSHFSMFSMFFWHYFLLTQYQLSTLYSSWEVHLIIMNCLHLQDFTSISLMLSPQVRSSLFCER